MDPIWPEFFAPTVVREGFGSGRLSSFAIALEAWRRGLTVTFMDAQRNTIEVSNGTNTILFNHSCPISHTPPQARQQLRSKWDTKILLEAAGVPVPKGKLLKTAHVDQRELSSVADSIGYPITIKPLTGSMGKGVFTGIASWEELKETYEHLRDANRVEEVVMEQHVTGDDYRVLVMGDRVLAACKRIPANVDGDGQKSINELIQEKNILRKQNPFLSKGLIKVDYELESTLKFFGYTIESVPAIGEKVSLRRIANASAGGDVIDVTDSIPLEIKDAAVSAVKAVPGIVIAGVDFLYTESEDSGEIDFSIIEMNYRPHIGVNMYPTSGRGRDIPRDIIDYFFPEDSRRLGSGERTIAFNWRIVKEQLEAGGSGRIPAAPSHRCPFRLAVRFERGGDGLEVDQALEIEHALRALDVHGHLRRTGNVYRLIAGGREDQVHQAVDSVAKLVGHAPSHTSVWRGRMQCEFEVRRTALRQKEPAVDTTGKDSVRRTRVSLVGDVLIHDNLIALGKKSADFTYSRQFERIASDIAQADVASANLESIAAGEAYGLSGFPSFNAPVELLDGLSGSGFEIMSVANNHMLDKGESALLHSIENVRQRGMTVTGAASTKEGLDSGGVHRVGGARVGFVSFTDGTKIPGDRLDKAFINKFEGESSPVKMIRRVTSIKNKINKLRNRADIVVLQLHFGEEYHKAPSAFQKELVASLAELNVDVIVGHHPHVLQPVEWIENSKGEKVLVAYSLGNFFSGQKGIYRQIGAILSFSIDATQIGGSVYHRVADPEMLLTYVDEQDSYTIRRFSDLMAERPEMVTTRGRAVASEEVYRRTVERLAEAGSGIKVH